MRWAGEQAQQLQRRIAGGVTRSSLPVKSCDGCFVLCTVDVDSRPCQCRQLHTKPMAKLGLHDCLTV